MNGREKRSLEEHTGFRPGRNYLDSNINSDFPTHKETDLEKLECYNFKCFTQILRILIVS